MVGEMAGAVQDDAIFILVKRGCLRVNGVQDAKCQLMVGLARRQRFVGLQFLMGGSAFTVVSLLVPTPTVDWTLLAALDLLFIILGGTAGAWILWLLLLSRGQASRVSTFLFGVPAVASLVGILAFGEPLSARFIAGFAAVAAGIGLVSARFVRSQTNPP